MKTKIAIILTMFIAPHVLAQPYKLDSHYGQPVRTSAEKDGRTSEVLVTNQAAATLMPEKALDGRRAVELQNLGPNPIWCSIGSIPEVNRARKVGAGETWALDAGSNVSIRCIASSAAQVTGAATIVTELR